MTDCEIGNSCNASKATGDSDLATKKSRMCFPIYHKIDTKKLQRSPPDFTVTFTEIKTVSPWWLGWRDPGLHESYHQRYVMVRCNLLNPENKGMMAKILFR